MMVWLEGMMVWLEGMRVWLEGMKVWLESAYYVAQILLFFTAIAAAYYAYHQLVSANRYELLRMLEGERFRNARRLLWKALCAPGASPAPQWWEDEQLEEAAAKTCASFDIVALMAKRSNRRFFSREWARSICWTYELLKPYIQDRHDPDAYKHYRELYKEALPFKPKPK
jgi:hypothetical protein